MPKTELLKLAERVEALSGPDRAVDYDIAHFVTGAHFQNNGKAPEYTAFLDAAMTLVERPAWIRIDEWPDEFNATSASVQLIRDPQVASHCAKGTTPALALCAAALRALAKEDS